MFIIYSSSAHGYDFRSDEDLIRLTTVYQFDV